MNNYEKAIAVMLLLAMAVKGVSFLRRHQRAVKHTLRVSADLYEKLAPTQKTSPVGVKFRQFSAFPLCWVGQLPMFRTKYFRKHRALYMDALGAKNEV